MALLAAVSAAISWGMAGFLAGREARTLPAWMVALWGRMAALAVLVPLAVVFEQQRTGAEFAWALLAGLLGPLALVVSLRLE